VRCRREDVRSGMGRNGRERGMLRARVDVSKVGLFPTLVARGATKGGGNLLSDNVNLLCGQMGLGNAVVPGKLVFVEEAPRVSEAEGDTGEN
jgi:hypothetical protein